MTDTATVLARFHEVLVHEIQGQRPEYLTGPFTVAEIYQSLVPYSSHRDRLGVEMNGDYEDALLRLLAGEGGYLVLDSDAALQNLREELDSSNPNTGLYREYAAVDVRLNPQFVPGGKRARFQSPVAVEELAPQDPTPAPDFFEEAPAAANETAPDGEMREAMHETPPPQAPFDGPRGPLHDDADSKPSADGAPPTCRWCRADLPERPNLNFCPFCGTDVHVVPCPTCSEELEDGWRFCPACGTEVGG